MPIALLDWCRLVALGRNLGLLRHSLCVVTVGCEVEANYWPDVDDVEREDGGPCRLAR